MEQVGSISVVIPGGNLKDSNQLTKLCSTRGLRMGKWTVLFTIGLISSWSMAANVAPETFQTIRDQWQSGNRQEALKLIDKELAKKPDLEDLKVLLLGKGMIAKELNNHETAKQAFEELVAKKTNFDEVAALQLGQYYWQSKDLESAKKSFEQSESANSNSKVKSEAQFYIGKISYDAGKFKEAKKIFTKVEKAWRGDDRYPEVLIQLARTERELKNKRQFCKWVEKIYERYHEQPEITTWTSLSDKNLLDEKPTGCVADLDSVRTRIKNLLWAGEVERAQKEIDQLRVAWGSERKYDSDKLQVTLFVHEGDFPKAKFLLNEHQETLGNSFGFLMMRANLFARAGEMKDAVEDYKKAYQMLPRSPKGKEALFQAAFMAYQGQDYEQSITLFKNFTKLYSGSSLAVEARWYLAWMEYLNGKYENAIKQLTDLQKLSIKKGRKRIKAFTQERVKYWVAMSYFKKGELLSAKQKMEPIAKSKNVSYYSILAQLRLSQIENQIPKGLVNNPDPKQRVTRFVASEVMVSSLDPESFSDDYESEEEMDLLTSDADEIDVNEEETTSVATNEAEDDGPTKVVFSNPMLMARFDRAREFMLLGLDDYAKWDLYEIEQKTRNHDYLLALVNEYEMMEHFHRSSYIAQVNFGRERTKYGIEGIRHLWEAAYPKAYQSYVLKYAKDFSVPNELVWGIMRAESSYKRTAVSPVGALGLMQVMPYTGKKVADLLKLKKFKPQDLLQPESAVQIGAKYLQRLSIKFDGNIPLIAAGYNAGPHRVKNWLKNFGHLDTDEFVEHIPFLETRNYVKKVVANYSIYSRLNGVTKPSQLGYLSAPITVKISDGDHSKETWEEI